MNGTLRYHIAGIGLGALVFVSAWLLSHWFDKGSINGIAEPEPTKIDFQLIDASDKVRLARLSFTKALSPDTDVRWTYSEASICDRPSSPADANWQSDFVVAVAESVAPSNTAIQATVFDGKFHPRDKKEFCAIASDTAGKDGRALLMTTSTEAYTKLIEVGVSPEMVAVESTGLRRHSTLISPPQF